MQFIKDKLKRFWKWLLLSGIVGTIALGAVVLPPESTITLEKPQVIEWTKPITDAQWAEDVKAESFHFKFDYQLLEMKISHEAKLPFQEEDLRKITDCPDCIKWELREQFEQMFEDISEPLTGKVEGKTLQQWIDGEFVEQLTNTTWEVEKLKQTIERLDNEMRLRAKGAVDRKDDQLRITKSTKRGITEQNKLRNQ